MSSKTESPDLLSDGSFWLGLLTPPLTILIVAPGMFLRAAVLEILWRWYLVPLGAPHMTFAGAFGITIVSLLMLARPGGSKDRNHYLEWLSSLMVPAILLLIGWAATLIL